MDDEEYAIVSKKEFMALKKELDKFKKNPLEGSETGENLQASIDNLNKSLNVMLEVFKQAAEDMKLEEHDTETVAKQMGPINEKIETLIDQNQKIAKGIVAIADMVKEKLEEISAASSKRLPPLDGGPEPRRQAPSPSFGPSPSYNPPSQMPMPEGLDDFGSGLPPLTPPGAPQMAPPMGPPMGPPQGNPGGPRKTILGGLMR